MTCIQFCLSMCLLFFMIALTQYINRKCQFGILKANFDQIKLLLCLGFNLKKQQMSPVKSHQNSYFIMEMTELLNHGIHNKVFVGYSE